MASVNKVILVGNLGKDPEIRSTQDGREIASFSIATSESWKDKTTGDKKEKTEWHNIVIFNPNLVTVVKNYVKKGSKLYLEGSLQTRKWVDKEGNDRYSTEVVLQNFNGTLVMLDGKKGSEPTQADAQSAWDAAAKALTPKKESVETGALEDSDIPF